MKCNRSIGPLCGGVWLFHDGRRIVTVFHSSMCDIQNAQMRQGFIHIGTRKTATKSVQLVSSGHSHELAMQGRLYPRAGRLESHPGHHNIAWEISADRRYEARLGTIADLLREIRSGTHLILSSEDMECALFVPDRFADFISCLQSAGYKIKFVLYVRNQADYLPRIYLTVVRFGLETAFNDVLIEVLDHAEFRFQEGVFGFDYVDLLNRLHAFPDVEVIVRSYDRIPASVCSDFLSIFGLGLSDVGLGDEVIANVSLPVEYYLQYFVRNRFGRDLSAAEQEAIRLIAMRADRLRMSPHAAQKVKRRFYDSNRKLATKCGIPEFGIFRSTESTHAAPREFCIDEVFSAATEKHLRQLPDT
jgi:hypothetical protein